ncbi:MAG: HIT family protein [Balneolaceae bacterium]
MATIFSRIIQQEIPSWKVGETDRCYAFLDIGPVSRGHTLVVPKEETDYLFDLSDDSLTELLLFTKRIARAIDRSLAPLRTGVVVQGLEVPHAHIHLIPIYTESQSMALGKRVDPSDKEMKEIAEAISFELNRG